MTKTNNAAHTYGPWVWEEGQTEIKRAWNGKEWTVASVEGSKLGWHEDHNCEAREAGANARLIAAAPELLEACQTFAEWLQREEGGFPPETRFNSPEGETKWREWFDENLRICALAQEQARAAIAKATGAPA